MQLAQQDTRTVIREAISFGPFKLFPAERVLERGGKPLKLGSRAFDLLLVLIENAGEVVSQKDLIEQVWRGLFVEDVALRVHIGAIRKALDVGESEFHYVLTVPGRGYMFTGSPSREAMASETDHGDTPATSLYRLPPAPVGMVGRDPIVRTICEMLKTTPLVTIVGPGGMGKTTVALAAAHALVADFRGAVCFLDLGTLTDPNLLPAVVTSSFGLPVLNEDPILGLLAHLRTTPSLLILDSAEHVIMQVAQLAERLAGELKDIRILVTSREMLRATSEVVVRLPPLESPPAGVTLTEADLLAFPAPTLFVQRAGRNGVNIALNGSDAKIVGDICRKLGGVALAIELAAGRVGTLTLTEMAQLLDSQFALRWPGRRTAPPRHQTLIATLEWSYSLLTESECKLLRRLSVFVGTFTLDDAQNVAADSTLSADEVVESAGGLVAKSLASPIHSDVSKSTRYCLLDTTRTYAALKLAEAGELLSTRDRHAHHVLERLQRAAHANPAHAVQQDDIDIEDVRAALHWGFGPDGDRTLALDLSVLAASVFLSRALFIECRDWMIKADAAVSGDDEKSIQRKLAIQLALASTEIFTVGISDALYRRWSGALVLAETVNDVPAQIACFLPLWGSEIRATQYDKAMESALRCTGAARLSGAPGPAAMAEWMLGHTEHHLGRLELARDHLRHALDTDPPEACLAQTNAVGYDRRVDGMGLLSNTLWLLGAPEQAQRLATQAVAEARPLQYALPLSIAFSWDAFNRYLCDPDIDAIEHDVVDLIEHARSYSIGSQVGIGLCLLGLCQTRRRQFDAAAPLMTEGLKLLAEANYEVFVPIFLAHLCEGAILVGNVSDAQSLIVQLERRDRNSEHWCTPEILRVKGLLARAGGDDTLAAEQFAKSIALARKQGALGWELKTATNLSGVLVSQSRDCEALDLLESLYGKFTEGFATVDLVAARRQLNELRSSVNVP